MTVTPQNPSVRPRTVTVFAWLLIISSIIHTYTLLFGLDWYRSNYNYWPDWLFYTRYCFSWLQRIVGICVGIGLLNGRELARRVAIWLGVFTIATLYWKHHYPAFVRHCQYLDSQFGDVFKNYEFDISFTSMALPAMIVHCLLDILFFGLLIYCLTRPSVKKYFQSPRP
jgi:hypothetical protein